MSNETDDTEFGDFVGASKPGSGKTTGPIKTSFPSNTPIDTKHVSPKPQQTTQTNTTPVPQKKSTELAWDNNLIDLDGLGKKPKSTPDKPAFPSNYSPLQPRTSTSQPSYPPQYPPTRVPTHQQPPYYPPQPTSMYQPSSLSMYPSYPQQPTDYFSQLQTQPTFSTQQTYGPPPQQQQWSTPYQTQQQQQPWNSRNQTGFL